jgi:hypothetical protein
METLSRHRALAASEPTPRARALRPSPGAGALFLAACLGSGFASCAGSRPSKSDPAGDVAREARSAEPVMWTRSFLDKSVLTAGVVEIEGPELLRERAVLRREEFHHEHSEHADKDGYTIEQRQRSDSDGSPIRAQLDELVIDAYERITIRIRPDAQRVVVRASDDVFLYVLSSGRETRTATLTLVGELDTPLDP